MNPSLETILPQETSSVTYTYNTNMLSLASMNILPFDPFQDR